MMEDTMQDLARRAVACKHWRWLPGMLRDHVHVTDSDGLEHVIPRRRVLWPNDEAAGGGPVLSDSATLGAFVEVVRLAHGAHVVWLQPSRQTWGWDARAQMPDESFVTLGTSRTGAEALVAALEAAP